MKNKFFSLIILCVAALAISGCTKSYKTVIDGDPIGKGAPVEINDHQDAGKVTRVFVDDAGHRIAQFTVNRSTEGLIREGIVHIRNGSVLQLRTDLATGPVLAAGSLIPTQSKLGFAVKKWGSSREALVTLAAAGAVICLCIVFAWRFARGLISLFLAIVLAAVTAYAASPLVLPIAQKIQQQVQSSSASASIGQNPGFAPSGWADKLKAVESDFANFLCTSPDAPRLVALLITFGVTFPIFAWLFRKITAPRMVCPLLILFAFPNVLTAAPEQTGVYYSRQFLIDEQSFCSRSLSEVDRNLDDATRLLDANLPGTPDDLVRALFLGDLVEIRLEGEPDRIARLKWSFGYVRAQERQEFNAVYAELSQRLQTEEIRAATLCQHCNAATKALTVLREYQANQDHFRSLARAGLSDPQAVLDECSRKLTQEAQATNAQPKVEDGGKTAAELARVQRQQAELQAQMADFRRSQQLKPLAPAPSPPRTIFVTNEIVRTIEKPVPTPVFLTKTNTERVFVTNTVVAAASQRPNSVSTAENASPPIPSVAVVGHAATSSNGYAPNTPAVRSENVITRMIPIVGTVALTALICAVVIVAFRNKGPFEIELCKAGTTGVEANTFTLENGECLVLNEHPKVETNADSLGPRIRVNWRGIPVLCPDSAQAVWLNGLAIVRPQKIKPGDEIRISSDNLEHTFVFRGCSMMENEFQGDAEIAATNSEQSKI